MKFIEILIKVRHYHRNDKVFQHFVYDEKNAKYIKSQQYKIYTSFFNKIQNVSLANSGYEFLTLRDEDDRVVLKFEDTKHEKLTNVYFVVSGFIPEYNGCDFCRYKKEEETYIYCEFMGKTLVRKKTCRFFMEEQ